MAFYIFHHLDGLVARDLVTMATALRWGKIEVPWEMQATMMKLLVYDSASSIILCHQ